jgi:hypothetical protein
MGDGGTTGILLIMMMCCALLVIVSGGYYWWEYGGGRDTYGSNATSTTTLTSSISTAVDTTTTSVPAPAPAPADPKTTLQATGRALQVAERDISAATDFGNCGADTSKPVAYTISMFLSVERTAGDWRNVFVRGGDQNRRPGIWLTQNDLKFHFRQATDDNANAGIDSTVTGLTAGQYTHVAFVNDGTTMSVYFNGTKDSATYSVSSGHTFGWGTDDAAHAAIAPYTANANGYVKVKELYWFNSALSSTQISQLAVASSSAAAAASPVDSGSSGSGSSGSGSGSPTPPPPPPAAPPGMVMVKKVRLERQTGSSNYLNINQIQVFDKDGVLITGMGASASSIIAGDASNYGPNKLIDGTTEHGSKLAHTNPSDTEWFQLELPTEKAVSKVVIYNRTDCCSDRIMNSTLKLMDGTGADVKTFSITYNQPVYVWKVPFFDGATATSSYRPEPISYGHLAEVGPINRAELPRRRIPTSFDPEPITSTADDYWGVIS